MRSGSATRAISADAAASDLTVAVNGQTLVQDYNEVLPGGYFLYDSTKNLPEACRRDDIVVIGIPLTELCNAAFTDPRLRQLLKNIIYVGALAFLLDIDFAILTDAISSQFREKAANWPSRICRPLRSATTTPATISPASAGCRCERAT